jgi:cyclomaltodextrinase / maltogenic alpha-amylase / neopullulanase
VDKNYFEIAYSLKRQFGQGGVYRNLNLYNFADNHDVNRVASSLINPKHLYPLYFLMFAIPGIPSIYYGSEWGLQGKRTQKDDHALRPTLNLTLLHTASPQPDLPVAIANLAQVRLNTPALCYGDYAELFVASEQFAFSRRMGDDMVIVLLNASSTDVPFDIPVPLPNASHLVDLLNLKDKFHVENGRLNVNRVYSNWGRILQVKKGIS